MSANHYKIGQIVPSSNITMEIEVPAMLRARESGHRRERFSFHSSRMRMSKVGKAELAAMDGESERCALELSDAQVDVIGYACLIAIMSMGLGYHEASERKLGGIARSNSPGTQVVTSAGALLDGLRTMGAKKVSIITPYMKPLTALVVEYLEHERIEVVDALSLEISDNRAVGARDPLALVEIARRLNIANADALVVSACVQMPSLAAVPVVEKDRGVPVLSAATSTTYAILQRLGIDSTVPGAGHLLSGAFA